MLPFRQGFAKASALSIGERDRAICIPGAARLKTTERHGAGAGSLVDAAPMGDIGARRLPFLLAPGDRETPADFLSRLAVRNGRDGLRAICSDFGIGLKPLLHGEGTAVAAVARLGHTSTAVLESSAFRPGADRRTAYRNQVFHNSMTTHHRIRFCPACLREDVEQGSGREGSRLWRRAEWQIPDLATCPDHSMVLADLGPDIGHDPFDFSRIMADHVPRLEGYELAAERRAVTEFERYLRDRLDGRPVGHGGGMWLDTFPMYAVIRFCELAGAVATDGVETPDRKQRDAIVRMYQATGFEALARGEEGFRQLLASLLASYRGRQSKRGPQAVFGRLYKWLSYAPRDPIYDPIRHVLREFWLDTMAVGPGERTAPFGWPIERRRLHSVRSASLEFGTNSVSLRKILFARGIARPDQRGLSDDMVTFDAAANESFLRDVAAAIQMEGAADHLDVTVDQMRAIVRAGLVVPIPSGKPGKSTKYRFRRVDLDSFVSSLLVDADPMATDDPHLLDLSTAVRRAGRTLVSILEDLRDRRLKRVGRRTASRGLSSILVDVGVPMKLPRVRQDQGLLVSEAHAASGIQKVVLSALAREGVIRSIGGRHGVGVVGRLRLDKEDFDRFRRECVPLAELASRLGQSPLKVRNALSKVGMKPLDFSSKVGAVFFDASDIVGCDGLSQGLNENRSPRRAGASRPRD